MKKKINKKLLARIGAVLACVLLVGALAVPAFADSYDYPLVIPPAPPSINLRTVYTQVYNYLKGVQKVSKITQKYCEYYAIDHLVDFSRINGGDFKTDMIGIPIDNWFTVDPTGSSAQCVTTFSSVNYGSYYFYITANNLETVPVLVPANIEIEIFQYSTEHLIDVFLTISNELNGAVIMEVEYTGYIYDDGDGNKFANLVVSNGFINLGSNNVSVLTNDIYVGYVGEQTISQSMLDMLFFGYNSVPLAPDELFNGYLEGATYYNAESWEDGWNAGFMKGYDYVKASDLYKQGYNAAISEIESGDFGRNLIGATLNTPLEALSNFNIVSWTTANGRTVNISIMTILSGIIGFCLFVWFLRMFAGG